DVVGRDLEMNNAIHQVIGVLPPMPAFPDANDIWITSASCPFRSSDAVISDRSTFILSGIFGKLREDVSLEQGSRDVNTIALNLRAAYPDIYSATDGYSADLGYLKDEMIGS